MQITITLSPERAEWVQRECQELGWSPQASCTMLLGAALDIQKNTQEHPPVRQIYERLVHALHEYDPP